MILKLINAKPIKPAVVRFGVELWEDNFIQGEYEVAIDVEKFITRPSENDEEIKFDFEAFQQEVTNAVARLQFEGVVAAKLVGKAWTVLSDKNE